MFVSEIMSVIEYCFISLSRVSCGARPERGVWLKALAGLINLEYSQETVCGMEIWKYMNNSV